MQKFYIKDFCLGCRQTTQEFRISIKYQVVKLPLFQFDTFKTRLK